LASTSAPLPIGLIGVGKHGARYLHHVERDLARYFRVVALSRRDATAGEETARARGVRFHPEPESLIADPAVRAVIAVLPPREHEAIVTAAAREQKPLLLEKPFAVSFAAGVRQLERLDAARLPCLVAHTLRFSGVVQAVRAQLPRIGAIHQMVLGQCFEPTRLDWLDDPARSGGGNILHTGVHMFDLLRYLTGTEVRSASCEIGRVATRRTEDNFAAALVLGSGAEPEILAAVTASRATHSRAGEIRLLGERGQIVADHVHRSVTLLEERRAEELPRPPDVPTVLEALRAFHAMLAAGAAPAISARDGLAAVAIADACYRAAETGKRAAVPLVPNA
jgi:myo-inositol 2-dehydrogenase / D-chiro-inositol 1-dehydrogenase